MRVQTIEMEQSFVTQHEELFMTFVQGGYEGDYDNACIFLTWSCVVEIYSSIACDNWASLSFVQYEIAECLEDPKKIHGDVGEGLSFATGLIYQLATLQAVIKNIERYIESFFLPWNYYLILDSIMAMMRKYSGRPKHLTRGWKLKMKTVYRFLPP